MLARAHKALAALALAALAVARAVASVADPAASAQATRWVGMLEDSAAIWAVCVAAVELAALAVASAVAPVVQPACAVVSALVASGPMMAIWTVVAYKASFVKANTRRASFVKTTCLAPPASYSLLSMSPLPEAVAK